MSDKETYGHCVVVEHVKREDWDGPGLIRSSSVLTPEKALKLAAGLSPTEENAVAVRAYDTERNIWLDDGSPVWNPAVHDHRKRGASEQGVPESGYGQPELRALLIKAMVLLHRHVIHAGIRFEEEAAKATGVVLPEHVDGYGRAWQDAAEQ